MRKKPRFLFILVQRCTEEFLFILKIRGAVLPYRNEDLLNRSCFPPLAGFSFFFLPHLLPTHLLLRLARRFDVCEHLSHNETLFSVQFKFDFNYLFLSKTLV